MLNKKNAYICVNKRTVIAILVCVGQSLCVAVLWRILLEIGGCLGGNQFA